MNERKMIVCLITWLFLVCRQFPFLLFKLRTFIPKLFEYLGHMFRYLMKKKHDFL